MIISSFYRMRCFRQGKASLVLKLCLPAFYAEAPEEKTHCERLNSFYTALAEAYSETATKLVSVREGRVSVSVNFAVVTEKYKSKYKRVLKKAKNPLIVERYTRSSEPLVFDNEHHFDVLDIGRGNLLK